MSQPQQQQNPLVPHLVSAQSAAVDAQKKVIEYHENQIRQLSEVLNATRAERDAYKKEATSLRTELVRVTAEQKDNIVVEETVVEIADETIVEVTD
jgi:phage-related minor tail protein